MRHCTVCGAEAREGAKFCTSCGARLQGTGTETSTLPSVSGTVEPPSGADPDPIADDAGRDDAGNGSSDDTVAYVPEQGEPAEAGEPADTAYVANWPATDDADASDDQAEQAEPDPLASDSSEPASWTSAFVSPEPASTDSEADDTHEAADESVRDDTGSEWSWSEPQDEPPAGTASEGDDDEAPAAPEESWPWAATDEAPSEPGMPDDSVPGDPELKPDHSGASTWESWEPAAAGPSTLDEHRHDPVGDIRGLLNDLADRIDRLVSPSTLESRSIDPDDLADQLDRWSRSVPDTEELLATVQEVRKSPRDLDAIARLADRAADLELLVRHYQSMTSSSSQWASDLRRQRDPRQNEHDA